MYSESEGDRETDSVAHFVLFFPSSSSDLNNRRLNGVVFDSHLLMMMTMAAKSPAAAAVAIVLVVVGPLLARGGRPVNLRSVVECLWGKMADWRRERKRRFTTHCS